MLEKLKGIPAFRGMTVQLFYPYGQGEASLALSDLERKTVLEEVVAMKKQGFPLLNSASRLTAMIYYDCRCPDEIPSEDAHVDGLTPGVATQPL